MKYRGKTAIVTGGASGIGRALAERMGALGAHVVVTDIQPKGEEVAKGIVARGGSAEFAVLDVTDASAFLSLVEQTVLKHRTIDFFFNNAGIAILGEARDFSLDDWKRIFDINVYGVVNGIHAVYPQMIRQGSGYIVNTASLAGLIPSPGFTAYCGTKHAVVGISTSLRYEAEPLGIKVSALCPGFVETAIFTDSKFVNIDPNGPAAGNARKLSISAEECAKETIKGMEKNKPLIIVTGHAKAAYFMSRYLSPLITMMGKQAVKEFKKSRTAPPKVGA